MVRKIITRQSVEDLREASPKRRRFSDHPVVYKKSDGRYIASTIFDGIDRLFEEETGIRTIGGPYGPYTYLNEAQFNCAKNWQDRRSSLVFLRDMLDFSAALDFNLKKAGVYTALGQAEHNAKTERDRNSINILVRACSSVMDDLSLYMTCGCVCAVPPPPDKEWDLPTEIAARLARRCGKKDISADVAFKSPKRSVKTLSLSERWGALEKAKLKIKVDLKGAKIILVDDKYQSGTTAQFVASKLYDAGAEMVCGLFCIKTWRDTDNT